MDSLSTELLEHIVSFLDVKDWMVMYEVSTQFSMAMDSDALWKRVGTALYRDTCDVGLYQNDWMALVRDRNRKSNITVMKIPLCMEKDAHRIYTNWQEMTGSSVRVGAIIDPYGNPNVTLAEPCLSVYLETDQKNVTLSFKIQVRRQPPGRHVSWYSQHHFTKEKSNWGVHRLLPRSEITPDSGYVHDDGCVHLRIFITPMRIRLYFVETWHMHTYHGMGLVDVKNMECYRFSLSYYGETLKTMRDTFFPQMNHHHLCFWICDAREGEGIVPIFKITEEQEKLPMKDVIAKHEYQTGNSILWIHRLNNEGLIFIKRMEEGHICWKKQMTLPELRVMMVDDMILVYEKMLRETTLDEIASITTDRTVVLLLLKRSELDRVRQIYQDYRDNIFHNLALLDEKKKEIKMETILSTVSSLYTNWRVLHYHTCHGNKHRLLHALIRRPHLGYACDHCGAYNFCGTRYKCMVCSDYDLCEACHSLPVSRHRYIFDHHIIRRVHSTIHETSHPLHAIAL